MRRMSWRTLVGMTLLVGSMAGCGGGDSNPGAGDGGGVKTYERASLPKTAQELPSLDEGRLEVPTPHDWQWRPKERDILARFHLKGRSGMPQIIVKLDAQFQSPVPDVTAANVAQYSDSVQADLDQRDSKQVEGCKPLILGSNAWARYVLPGKLPGKQVATIERQILKTTRGGRTYTVELQVPIKELLKYRDAAYAVAAGMRFSAGGGSTGKDETATDDKTDAKPEETK